MPLSSTRHLHLLRHCILALATWALTAMSQNGVTLSMSSEQGDGSRTAILQNSHIKAVFNTLGGRLVSLIDLKSGKDLVWDNGKSESGSCKDQFPPMQFDFRDSQYVATILENTPDQCTLKLQSTDTSGKWKFLKITRTYTLRRNERLIAAKISLHNQQESMAPMRVEYWQHNFFGVKDEETRFFVPTTRGTESMVPSEEGNRHFFRNLTRGWLAMIGKGGTGIAVMPEFRRMNLVYAWWCRAGQPLDTLEWRLVPENIREGDSLDTVGNLGVIQGLPAIHGAGSAGAGAFILPDAPQAGNIPLTLKLLGFSPRQVRISIRLNGKQQDTITTGISPDSVTDIKTTLKSLSKKTYHLNAQVLDAKTGKMLFDLNAALNVAGAKENINVKPLEQRLKPATTGEPWQFNPSDEIITPHCRWLEKDSPDKVLFMLPANGIRDAIEMKQRMPITPVIPTIFPKSWDISWWTNCVLPPGSAKNGTEYLFPDFLRGKSYKAFVIGTEVRCPWDKQRVFWTSFPANVRQEILRQVREGAGLLYINPAGEDDELKSIFASLKELPLKNSMDLQVAPFFNRTKITGGTYGKGRIAVLRYPVQGYLIPQAGSRTNVLQLLRNDHRYQEYPFAILCRLLNWSMGQDPLLTKISWKGNQLTIEAQKKGKVTLELLDRYSTPVTTLTHTLKAGLNTLTVTPPRSGRNFVHVKFPAQDFGFASQIAEAPARILDMTLKPHYRKTEPVTGTVTLSNEALKRNCQVQIAITDQTGRLVHRQQGPSFSWNQRLASVNRHTVTATLLEDGKVLDVRRNSFNLPEHFNATENFSHLLWASTDIDPEYSIPYRWEADRRFGFNFLYAGSTAESAFCKLMQLANMEIGSNWLGDLMFHTSMGLAQWQKTHDKKYLIRPTCPNNPNQWNPDKAGKAANLFHDFGTRHVFQLGDEMSMTYYNSTWDVCFCQYCLKDFRKWLKQNRYQSLDKLNQDWATSFKTWDQVTPMTRIEVLMHGSVAPWVEHRLYMDHLFARTLQQVRQRLQSNYPGAKVGPTGVNNPPHPYGGNWNFYNMRDFECASIYGTGRIPLSFNRDRRFVMQYRGYSNPPAEVTRSFWEGLIAGERNTNNWYEPIFVLPDLRESQVRSYYKDLLWELRSGTGDLFYHSQKLTNQVAILHSQSSLIANFIKQKKTDYYQKELSFAQALEDAGIPYRFIAPEELIEGALKNFQALILPEASAMSDREVELVSAFVNDGGILLADYDAAIQNQHCTPRKAPAFNQLFGVKIRRFKLRRAKHHNLPGFAITHVGMGVQITDGRARFKATTARGDTPLVIVKNNGKGQAILLNFVTDYNKTREHGQDQGWPTLLASLLKQDSPAHVNAPCPVMHGFYVNGQNLYVGLQPVPPRGNWTEKSLADVRKLAFKAPLKTRQKGWLYDVRKGQKLGYGNAFSVSLIPGDGTILALMPYEINSVTIQAPAQAKPGDVTTIKASIKASAPAGHHVLLMTVSKPDGTQSLDYRTIKNTLDGQVEFRIPFAYNDQRGTWKITVKDAASGLTATHNLRLL